MASETSDPHLSASTATQSDETLSPLEQEVLDEYARLLGNLNNVRHPQHPMLELHDLANASRFEDVLASSRFVGFAERGYIGWSEGLGEEDESCVYVVEGECV